MLWAAERSLTRYLKRLETQMVSAAARSITHGRRQARRQAEREGRQAESERRKQAEREREGRQGRERERRQSERVPRFEGAIEVIPI